MSNPTTPFSWQMPTATDLVTDLPADFEVFGQAVATSMADLLGGTTGQILSKATNADMDFTWIANDQGDITGITATSPLTGGGSSGAITVGIQSSSTSQSGAVQLSDSTSTTSSILAATPTAVKSAYDLANGAIAKSTVTTAGDIIYRNATVPARLGIGTAGQILQVNSGATAPEWATVASGGFTFAAYTPTYTNLTLGNGTVTARYGQSGKFVYVSYKLVFGSTTSITSTITFSLPVTAINSNAIGDVYILDAGTAEFICQTKQTSTTAVAIIATQNASNIATQINNTFPMTWTTNDEIRFSLVYEAA